MKDKEVRVLMLGLDNSGKTTIVRSLLGQDVREVSPTMGFNIDTVEREGYTLNIWDVGGQQSLRPFWFNYFDRTDALIWVVDAVSLERLAESFAELDKILQEDRLIGSSLLVLVNKTDLLSNELEVSRVVSQITELLGLRKLTNHEWRVFPVSAISGLNIEKLIDFIINETSSRLFSSM